MCLIQDADNLLVVHTADDLDLFLELPLGVAAIETGFQSKLVQHALIKPPWGKL